MSTRHIKLQIRLPDAVFLGMVLISMLGLAYRWLHR